jgi:hypothetical protein
MKYRSAKNNFTHCMACKKPLSFNYESTIVRKAIKPKGHFHRWVELGAVHEDCEHLVQLEQEYGVNAGMAKWQTQKTQNLPPQGMGVQVPLPAPICI